MTNYQYDRAGGADSQKAITHQVNLFLFDLKNEASEHGFKPDDPWTLQLATDEEVTSLKKQHHPIIFLKLLPEALLNVFRQVKNELRQSLSNHEGTFTVSYLTMEGINQIAAYPALKTTQVTKF
jgi:hypothetical protein